METIKCIECKSEKDSPFKDARPMFGLYSRENALIDAVAEQHDLPQKWKEPFEHICAPCLKELVENDKKLHSLIKGTQLEEDLKIAMGKFGANRLSGIFGKIPQEK
ncbi:hypothetical protein P5815_02960 [Bacillus cereus]|uniref:hypothetical protein n=1 Tax=Bacillus TaxID=1386 RepID=UPI0018F56344|nr:hypothetical protein [Bacillus cereus]MBJ7951392.1 hypothetical protein [Bacillus cereus]MBX9155612.1 hypothetical protein [Bacillus cereus]MDF9519533.1 hypothetical protein [Bacillus cereus]MDF9562864.1 hypothetical protein [Bacillus cereus]MDZ4452951.1 hypothetical protein [Bacillus cereus]